MHVYIKGIRFRKPDLEQIFKFLEKNKKTQVIAERLFFGKKHIEHALLETKRAFKQKTNICKKEELEFLVRLVGERQIKTTLKKVKPTKKSIFICWSKNCSSIFKKFKKEFNFTEFKPKEPGKDKTLTAMEKTGTFWL